MYYIYIYYVYIYIYIYYVYITLTLKSYSKMRRAADIISHSSSKRRSILSGQSPSPPPTPNVTGCSTACIGASSLAVELDNAIWLRFLSGPL